MAVVHARSPSLAPLVSVMQGLLVKDWEPAQDSANLVQAVLLNNGMLEVQV